MDTNMQPDSTNPTFTRSAVMGMSMTDAAPATPFVVNEQHCIGTTDNLGLLLCSPFRYTAVVSERKRDVVSDIRHNKRSAGLLMITWLKSRGQWCRLVQRSLVNVWNPLHMSSHDHVLWVLVGRCHNLKRPEHTDIQRVIRCSIQCYAQHQAPGQDAHNVAHLTWLHALSLTGSCHRNALRSEICPNQVMLCTWLTIVRL